jgi:hypothetical protein
MGGTGSPGLAKTVTERIISIDKKGIRHFISSHLEPQICIEQTAMPLSIGKNGYAKRNNDEIGRIQSQHEP